MNTKTTTTTAAAILALAAFSGSTASAAIAFGLTSTGLVQFDTSAPGTITSTSAFSGLTGGDVIADIDYRPQDGTLYGLAQTGRLYRINPLSGATVLDTSGALGTVEHMDFNPVANRLRVLSATDHNYRITPGTGVLTDDGVFTFAAGDANNGANPTLGSAAYTNNFIGAVSTSLYSIDTALDVLILHTGAPQFSTLTTVGPLGVNVGSAVGFDIVGATNDTYVTNGQSLFSINLNTGSLTSLGTIGGAGVIGLAVVPEPSSAAVLTLAVAGGLMRRRR